MAITFIEQAQRQKRLIIVFLIVILITVFFLWRSFFQKPPPPTEVPLMPVRKIEINFEVLKNPILNELQSFEKIPSVEEAGIKVGRENPFTPY